MTQSLTRYHALYESVRSRRQKPEHARGVDALAARALMKWRERGVSLRWLRAEAEAIAAAAPPIRAYSDAALAEAIREVSGLFVRQRQDASAVRRALALVREAARRETGEEAFVVQLMGALALVRGRVIEMLTGEGKTLTGSIAAPLIAWQRRRLHVFTVNDYLARRDAQSRQGIYRRCGLGVGAIQQEMDFAERFDVYARAIVYGTPKQITADWLRDQIRLRGVNSAWSGRQWLLGQAAPAAGAAAGSGGDRPDGATAGPLVPGLRAAMVDEADAVLIDEGVVPLIIARSRQLDEMGEVYRQARDIAARLDEGPDYRIDHLRRRAELRPRGEHRAGLMFEELLRAGESIWGARRRAEELVRQALVARHCYLRGRQYQVVDGRVVIVDEYTGRFLADRSWEHGLHQAVEAKEGLEVTADRETLARMSFQRFFRSYPFLCGMTGTAADATGEMERVYQRPVIAVPTNRPMIRVQRPTRVFRSAEARWAAVVESILELHDQGRPVLVGTRSIAASEHLAARLAARGLEPSVLNANFDKEEAAVVARAGAHRAITVATNMAGRGTDIKPDARALQAGGLHVILTEMHGAKRIDRQFIGRAGRQGDPGSAQILVSLDDELVRLHAPGWAAVLARAAARGSGEELTGSLRRLALRVFRLAQKRSERRARLSRASVLRQDDWVEKHLPGA